MVQVIQAADPSAAPGRPRERAGAAGNAPKAPKYREDTSPARNQQYYHTEEAVMLSPLSPVGFKRGTAHTCPCSSFWDGIGRHKDCHARWFEICCHCA